MCRHQIMPTPEAQPVIPTQWLDSHGLKSQPQEPSFIATKYWSCFNNWYPNGHSMWWLQSLYDERMYQRFDLVLPHTQTLPGNSEIHSLGNVYNIHTGTNHSQSLAAQLQAMDTEMHHCEVNPNLLLWRKALVNCAITFSNMNASEQQLATTS